MTARAGQAAVRLRVNFMACDGRGLCAEALPELITLDDWGFPIVGDQPVPPRLVADARETTRLCPKLALQLERATASSRPAAAPQHRPAAPGRS